MGFYQKKRENVKRFQHWASCGASIFASIFSFIHISPREARVPLVVRASAKVYRISSRRLFCRRGGARKKKEKLYATTTVAASWLEAGELQPWPFPGSFPPFSRHGATKTRSLGRDKGIALGEEKVSQKTNLWFTGRDKKKQQCSVSVLKSNLLIGSY